MDEIDDIDNRYLLHVWWEGAGGWGARLRDVRDGTVRSFDSAEDLAAYLAAPDGRLPPVELDH